MSRKSLIDNLSKKIDRLPDDRIQEIDDFADFLLSKIEDQIIIKGIQKLSQDSKAFEFLKEEDDIYTVNDLKEKYK